MSTIICKAKKSLVSIIVSNFLRKEDLKAKIYRIAL